MFHPPYHFGSITSHRTDHTSYSFSNLFGLFDLLEANEPDPVVRSCSLSTPS
jgi:hypothetical protein